MLSRAPTTPPRTRTTVLRPTTVCFAIIIAVISVYSCGHPPFRAQPNVVLISLDTLRRDAVGPRQGRETLTPHIDEFSESAITYAAAFTTIPFTPSAHMTMLTGRHHAVHGVAGMDTSLPLSIPTLAEIASSREYHTIGRYTSEWLKPDFGFARGFESYEKVEHGPTYAWRVNESAIRAIDELGEPHRPFVLFLHYYDAHSDFVSQSRTSWPYFAPSKFFPPVDANENDFCTENGECATQYLIAVDREHLDVPENTLETLRALYESGVRYTDQAIGELIQQLEVRGLLDNSVVIITSDHGEEFREHNMLLHSQVYEETVAVPLIVRFPRGLGGGQILRRPVDLREVFSIIDFVTQGDTPIKNSIGRRLPIRPDAPIVFQDKIRKKTWGLQANGWKIVVDFQSGRAELYRRGAGDGDTEDLSSQNEGVKRELMDLLSLNMEALALARTAVEKDTPLLTGSPLTEVEIEHLKALGYLQ